MELFVYSPKSLGKALLRRRNQKKLTQAKAGEPFRLEQSTVSNIENGVPGTRIDTIFRLLAALDLEMIIRSKRPNTSTKDENW